MKKPFTFLLVLILLLSVGPAVYAEQAEAILYDGNQLEVFAARSKEEIGQQYSSGRNSGETYINRDSATYYTQKPSTQAPYDPGTLTEDTLAAMEGMVNFYRWLVGVEPLMEHCGSSEALQAGALVRNWDFNHRVSDSAKPEDMDADLWEFGAAASHNILALGYTPIGAVTGWLNEGYNLRTETWDTVGHRTTLLNAETSALDFGYSGSVAIGRSCAWENTFQQPFAAFPAPGYMPLQCISATASAWTVELNQDYFQILDESAVKVTVTDLTTGSSYECTAANGMLDVYSTLSFVQPASGVDSSAYRYAEAERFQVDISGLTDTESGAPAQITYCVEFFDVTPYTNSYATNIETISGWNTLHLTKIVATEENLNLIGAILPEDLVITADSGLTVSAKTTGKWVLDQENQRWINYVDPDSVPDTVTDRLGLFDQEIEIAYQLDSYTGGLYFRTDAFVEGKSGEVRVWNYMMGCPNESVYTVIGNGVDGYTITERFNRGSTQYYRDDNGYHCYTVDQWTASDSGKWLAIYSDPDFGYAYVAGVVEIGIEHNFGNWTTVTQPTYVKSGLSQRICSGCGETESRVIEPIGNPFTDVAAGAYYEAPVLWAVDTGITKGTSAVTFEPDSKCTRDQVVTFLWRAAGCPEPALEKNPFTDVTETDYFYEAVLWAVENQITKGIDQTHFGPGLECTRGQVATFLWRTLGEPESTFSTHPFRDIQATDYYFNAVLWAVEAGVTNGTSDNTFEPNSTCTRGQIVTFLHRALN